MKLNKSERLFIGLKLDSKIREALHFAKPSDKKYFDDPESDFLRVAIFEQEKWLGKVMKGGMGVNDMPDIERNVISILRRIAPNVRNTSASLKIFALSDEDIGFVRVFDKKPDQASADPVIDY